MWRDTRGTVASRGFARTQPGAGGLWRHHGTRRRPALLAGGGEAATSAPAAGGGCDHPLPAVGSEPAASLPGLRRQIPAENPHHGEDRAVGLGRLLEASRPVWSAAQRPMCSPTTWRSTLEFAAKSQR
jgi:hypothetical protein